MQNGEGSVTKRRRQRKRRQRPLPKPSSSPTSPRARAAKATASRVGRQLELLSETHNITSYGEVGAVLAHSEAHLLVVQETHADEQRDKVTRALAGKMRWKAVSTPAVPTNGGNTGGTMICTWYWLGLGIPPGAPEGRVITPGRALAASWAVPGQPEICVIGGHLSTVPARLLGSSEPFLKYSGLPGQPAGTADHRAEEAAKRIPRPWQLPRPPTSPATARGPTTR